VHKFSKDLHIALYLHISDYALFLNRLFNETLISILFMDLFDKLLQNRGPLGKFSPSTHGYITFPRLEGEIGPWMKFKGKTILNWSLNNYLGLANHPEVRKADIEGAAKWGMAYPMGARMMSGDSDLHEEVENALAKFVGKESAYLLNYGYQGIMSAIDSLVDRHDVVVYDAECHACIIDGLRMHTGKRFVYQHNDIISLEKQLVRATKIINETGGAILVITEGVFGMSGAQGKLKEIVALKDTYQFRLLVDDAHGFGTMGATGAGTGEHQFCQQGIDIYFSTFAKSMASIGAFIASDFQVIDYLRYNMRSQIFAKSLPLAITYGIKKRLELLQSQPELKENLWKIVNLLQSSLREKGFNIGNTTSPVTPVILECVETQVARLAMDLRENFDLFCSPVCYPVIPKGLIILRLIPTALHTADDVKRTVAALEVIYDRLKNNAYSAENLEKKVVLK
jgi:glycine C-acetyltransferase